jgi:hypothetical protein
VPRTIFCRTLQSMVRCDIDFVCYHGFDRSPCGRNKTTKNSLGKCLDQT